MKPVIDLETTIKVWVIGIDTGRRRGSLSMVAPEKEDSAESQPQQTESKPVRAPHMSRKEDSRTDRQQQSQSSMPMRGFDELQKAWNGSRDASSD